LSFAAFVSFIQHLQSSHQYMGLLFQYCEPCHTQQQQEQGQETVNSTGNIEGQTKTIASLCPLLLA
jgi:hypothetical protein